MSVVEGTVAAIKRRKERRERVALEMVLKAQGSVPQGDGPLPPPHPNQAKKGWLLLLRGSMPGAWGKIISLGQEKCPFPVYLCVLSPEWNKRL